MKLAPFFHGNAKYKITQTYHGSNASNPNDLSKQCAVDFSALGGANVYAVADGTIVNATASAGGYCTLDIDEDWWVIYVHTTNWLPIGTKVRRGQKIAQIKSMGGSHLHLALKNKSGRASHPQLMDYVDRSVPYVSGHPDITKLWFKNGNPNVINWNNFRDLSLTMAINIGQKLEFTEAMNLRDVNYKDIGDIAKGAVAEVVGKGATHDGYQWYYVRFADKLGQVADTSRNRVTTKLITNINGSAPIDECVKKIQEAVQECTLKWSAMLKDEKVAHAQTRQELDDALDRVIKLETDVEEYGEQAKKDKVTIGLKEKRIINLEKKNEELQAAIDECMEGRPGCLSFLGRSGSDNVIRGIV